MGSPSLVCIFLVRYLPEGPISGRKPARLLAPPWSLANGHVLSMAVYLEWRAELSPRYTVSFLQPCYSPYKYD